MIKFLVLLLTKAYQAEARKLSRKSENLRDAVIFDREKALELARASQAYIDSSLDAKRLAEHTERQALFMSAKADSVSKILLGE
ncbi:hypothetical protein BN109_013 [Yersinia phage phi80-18]|uniref:Uncharacterized protein n=1 Tax=Yersinia phage phi80-18 TaxID=1206559 RepID=I7LET4_9CAUD|nr:hypothetical protein BN109_013 [Yersinia phage phi80-18]CCI88852.2 hypothetical protein BN109_013 [Yersinia phage phi80-18]